MYIASPGKTTRGNEALPKAATSSPTAATATATADSSHRCAAGRVRRGRLRAR